MMYTRAWEWIGMINRDKGQAASTYSLEDYSGYLPAKLRSRAVVVLPYYLAGIRGGKIFK